MIEPVMNDRRGPGASRKNTLSIYTLANCGFCQRAKTLLDQYKISYVEHSLDGDEVLRQQVVERSGGRKVLPQFFINERHLGGFFEVKRYCIEGDLRLMLMPA